MPGAWPTKTSKPLGVGMSEDFLKLADNTVTSITDTHTGEQVIFLLTVRLEMREHMDQKDNLHTWIHNLRGSYLTRHQRRHSPLYHYTLSNCPSLTQLLEYPCYLKETIECMARKEKGGINHKMEATAPPHCPELLCLLSPIHPTFLFLVFVCHSLFLSVQF